MVVPVHVQLSDQSQQLYPQPEVDSIPSVIVTDAGIITTVYKANVESGAILFLSFTAFHPVPTPTASSSPSPAPASGDGTNHAVWHGHGGCSCLGFKFVDAVKHGEAVAPERLRCGSCLLWQVVIGVTVSVVSVVLLAGIAFMVYRRRSVRERGTNGRYEELLHKVDVKA